MTGRTAEAPAATGIVGEVGLETHGLDPVGPVHWNLSAAQLCEAALARGEGQLADLGPFVAMTAPHTGRSPNDKFVVREPVNEADVAWGKVNRPLEEAHYRALRSDLTAFLSDQELFVRDARAGEDPDHGINVRLVSTHA